MTKILFLTDMISPMKVPVYEELSKKYDLELFFCKKKTKDRLWETSLDRYSFKHNILKCFDIGPFFLNYNLPQKLFNNDCDVYIIGETPETILSVWTTLISAKIRRKPIVLLSGAISDKITHTSVTNGKKRIMNLVNFFAKKIVSLNRWLIYKLSDSFAVYGKFAKNFLISKGVDKNKIFTGTQIMPESMLSKPTKKSKPKEFKNKKIILYLGYLNKRKGVDNLIKAFNKLKRKDAILLIAGDGEEKKNLICLANPNKNIKFIKYVEGVEKADYYTMSDFFVLPTNYDVWGLVINEAFYYGIPVISTNKAGVIELIEEGKTGFIIPDKNTKVLAEKMKLLLDNPKLLRDMKSNVKKIPKSKIVDIDTSVKPFEKAINYTLRKK